MKNKTPTVLVIMDGFGMGAPGPGNAVTLANTPVLDRLFAENANTTLSASGLDVGLPAGQMGNSEVGHTNIGGGRVVFQDLPRISHAIETGEFFKNPAYNKAMDDCLEKGSSLHLYGLLSSGGVHSTVEHLWALLQMAKDKGLERVYIHAFLDGRFQAVRKGEGPHGEHGVAELHHSGEGKNIFHGMLRGLSCGNGRRGNVLRVRACGDGHGGAHVRRETRGCDRRPWGAPFRRTNGGPA